MSRRWSTTRSRSSDSSRCSSPQGLLLDGGRKGPVGSASSWPRRALSEVAMPQAIDMSRKSGGHRPKAIGVELELRQRISEMRIEPRRNKNEIGLECLQEGEDDRAKGSP